MRKNVIINFCPTGVKPNKTMTKHVPISPEEIAEQTFLMGLISPIIG